MANRWGNSGSTDWLYFLGSKITADGNCSHEIKRRLLLGRKVKINLDSILKSRDITLPTKVHLVKAIVFPVVMYECESWTINKAKSWRIDAVQVVLEKTLESPLVSKEIKPVHPKGNQPWIFIGRTDGETLILWSLKRRLIGKDPDAGKDWRDEEKWMTEDEMVGWHHRFSGHEFFCFFFSVKQWFYCFSTIHKFMQPGQRLWMTRISNWGVGLDWSCSIELTGEYSSQSESDGI